MQMPVWALGSAPRSQKRPRLSSHGRSSEQLSPRWRAHTRQQEQSSSTALTPGAQTGGVLGQGAGHREGQRAVAATWGAGDTNGELQHGPAEAGRPGTPRGGSGGPSNQGHLGGAPLTCPRRWRRRPARPRHCLGRRRPGLGARRMLARFPPAASRGGWPGRGGALRAWPPRRPRAGFIAAPGPRTSRLAAAQGERGSRQGGEWNEPRGCHGNWPWVPLSLGRGPGACGCLCVATGFSRSAGRGWAGAPGRAPGLAPARGKETPVSSWKLPCLPPGPGHRRSHRTSPWPVTAAPQSGAFLKGCLGFGAIWGLGGDWREARGFSHNGSTCTFVTVAGTL